MTRDLESMFRPRALTHIRASRPRPSRWRRVRAAIAAAITRLRDGWEPRR